MYQGLKCDPTILPSGIQPKKIICDMQNRFIHAALHDISLVLLPSSISSSFADHSLEFHIPARLNPHHGNVCAFSFFLPLGFFLSLFFFFSFLEGNEGWTGEILSSPCLVNSCSSFKDEFRHHLHQFPDLLGVCWVPPHGLQVPPLGLEKQLQVMNRENARASL